MTRIHSTSTRAALLSLVAAICVVATAGLAPAAQKQAEGGKALKPQTTCPVMGGAINKDLYVEKDGKRIYVCCGACIAKVKADFSGYEKKLADAGQAVAHVQTTCPIMGGAVNKDLYVDQGGKRIYVCCSGCIKPVKENFQKNVGKIRESGQYVASTPEKK